MSDASEDLAEALALNKRLAAARLVRKQELEAALAKGEGDPALSAELATVDAEYRAALAELDALKKLAKSAPAQVARAIVSGATAEKDPLIQTDEERALEGARGHIADLDAQVRLGGELAGDGATTATTSSKPLTREEADAQARAEFEERRAKLGKPAAPPKKTL